MNDLFLLMTQAIMTLTKLLKNFNYQTIQRSLAYVNEIDQSKLERVETHETIQLTAYIKGTKKYRTAIIFNKKSNHIAYSTCTCPVGNFCKHAAALGRLLKDMQTQNLEETEMALTSNLSLMQELITMIEQPLSPSGYHALNNILNEHSSSSQPNHPSASRQYDAANLWLKNLRQSLHTLEQAQKSSNENTNQSPFIYLIEQQFGELRLHLQKVRRIKSGEIREAKAYSQFHNITYNAISLPTADKALFNQIYHHVNSMEIQALYSHYLLANELPLDLLKQLIDKHMLFSKLTWDKAWQSEQAQPITWSPDRMTLAVAWLESDTSASERLRFSLLDSEQHRYGFGHSENYEVLFTKPLTFMNKTKRQIGLVNSDLLGDIPNDLLYRLISMPEIPKELVSDVEDVLTNHQATQNLPKPKNSQPIEAVYGTPQPIIRFTEFNENNLPWDMRYQYWENQRIPVNYVKAELAFAYETAKIDAGLDKATAFVRVQKNGKCLNQYRDINAENKAIKALKKLFTNFKWLKTRNSLGQYQTSKHEATLEFSDALNALLPTDKFAAIGWQVEHASDSPLNVQPTQDSEMFIEAVSDNATALDDGNHWFEVGATIQDEQGYKYDLLNIVAYLLKQYPYLLHQDIEHFFAKDHLFVVDVIDVGGGRPRLAIAFKQILPIIQNLSHLLSQEDRKLDRYDAVQVVDLEHTLGMAWQVPDKLKKFAEQLKAGYQSNLPTPTGFNGELRPYQQQGLAWLQFLAQTEHGGILADDMGLGKTAQTLAHILMQKQAGQLTDKPVLIVAPTSLMHNWQKEANKFTPDLAVLLLHGANRHDKFEQMHQHDIVLTTYPLVVRDEDTLKNQAFHQIILDKAQNIKNPHSKSAQVLRSLTAKHRLCLTGTPMENHLGELWSLFYFLMPGFLGSQEVFNKHYRHPIEKKADNHKRKILVNRIKPFMLRRLKTEVATELPPKTTIEVNIDMNETQSKLYEAVRATMQDSIKQLIAEQGFKRSQIQILDALLKLRQVCCHPSFIKLENLPANKKMSHSKALASAKLDYLIEMVNGLVEEGRKILIFSQFTTMLALIEAELIKQNIGFSKLTGKTKKRDAAIDAFQSGQVPVFLISLKAGGVGLNLTTADTVIHYDPWWNPAAEDQASDRAWRIGQDKPVFVYKLITNQSIEEKIITMQHNKAQLANSILSTDHEGEVKLDEAALLGLFERFV